MLRTQVYLPEELYRQVIIFARLENIPVAKVIREALRRGLEPPKKKRNDLLLLGRLGISGGPKDLSRNLDKYLYGRKTR